MSGQTTRAAATATTTATGADTPFDLAADLPAGVTVLEASAGTGKTYTIAALAARYVAAGLPLRSLLLVTFTRMATGELRQRVRDRLAGAERELARVLAGGERPIAGSGDEVLEILTAGDDEELAVRHAHLAAALADFDAATISTIHGFCQTALTGLGVAADVDGDVTFVEDTRDLLGEIVDDFYIRKFQWYNPPAFPLSEARRIARDALGNPLAPLQPADAEDGSVPQMRFRFATAVRAEMEHRKRERKLLTFDDLLTQLAHTLRDPVRGPVARRRLRAQYRVVLVDEFQDTDPIQWEIMSRAFGPDPDAAPDARREPELTEPGTLPRALVLIGDPKQAIYAFRGADVQAYLDAAHAAGARSTLSTNWRSDQGLLTAFDALLHGVNLGHEEIAYRKVEAAPVNVAPRLVGAPVGAPLRLRVVHREDKLVRTTPKEGWVSAPPARAHIAADLAADVVGLLRSGAEILKHDAEGNELDRRPVAPGDLAVLVRSNRQTAMVCEALGQAGVPAVINGAGSVFGTPLALEWLALLEALERPASEARVHAVARTCFFGWTAEQIAAADDHEWETVHARLHRWAVVLREFGVASLLERITHRESLPARLLERQDGDRRLTDLRHIGQLLHAESMASSLGLTSLAAWLRQRIQTIDDVWPDDQSRRLESDADAVQVLTIHRSKGLEFPIVYFPFLWEKAPFDEEAPQLFHDRTNDNRLTIDVGLAGGGFDEHVRQALEEQRGEDLRLLYVALTRARHQAVVWWASTRDGGQSPLGRLLFARDLAGNIAIQCAPPPEDALVERLARQDATAAGLISLERTAPATDVWWEGPPQAARVLAVRSFDRELDLQWRRTSYTALTSGVREPGVATEPEDVGLTDEALLDDAVVAVTVPAAIVAAAPDGGPDPAELPVVPLATMPGGASVGSLVHAMFEHTDFTAPDLDAELGARLDDEAWRQLDLGDPAMVVAGLRASIETPLGPLVGDRSLRDLTRADRLDELDFELPLAGGDEPSGRLTLLAIADLLRRHLPADDVLAGYPDRLADLDPERELRGYLVGSIDLSMRVVGPDGTPRVTVVDYKTNWLGGPGDPLTAWAYRPAALVDAMEHAHYPLQALIYSVALHRYLRWRVAGYDAARHLGGVLYLFIRGMTGTDVPRVGGHPCGVFSWQPPPALIVELSDLFDEGTTS